MTPYVRIGIVFETIGSLAVQGPPKSGSRYWEPETLDILRNGYWLDITERITSDFPEIEEGGERGWFKFAANDIDLTVVDEDEAVLAIITNLKYAVDGEDPFHILRDNVPAPDRNYILAHLENKNLGGALEIPELYRMEQHVVLEIYDGDRAVKEASLLYRGICPYTMSRTLSPNVTQKIKAYSYMTKFMQRRRVTLNPSDIDGAALDIFAIKARTVDEDDYDAVVGVSWYDGAAWRLEAYVKDTQIEAFRALAAATDSQNVYGVKVNGTRAPQVLKMQETGDAPFPLFGDYGDTGRTAHKVIITFALDVTARDETVQPFGVPVYEADLAGGTLSEAIFFTKDNDRLVTLFERPALVDWFRILAQKLRSPASVNHPMFAQGNVFAQTRANGSDDYGVMLGSDYMICDWLKPISADVIMQELCKYSGGRWWTDFTGIIYFRPRTSTNATWDIADEYIEQGDTFELDSYNENEHLLKYSLGDSIKLTENPGDPYDLTTQVGKRNHHYRNAFKKQPEYRTFRIPWTVEFAEIVVGDKIRSVGADGIRRVLGRVMSIKWPNYLSDKGQMIELKLERRG